MNYGIAKRPRQGKKGRRFRNSCRGKVRHNSFEQAVNALEKTRGDRIEQMTPYKCEYCRGFHNGHQRSGIGAEPLIEWEPRCGCGHGADAHEDWWVEGRRCAYCFCVSSRQAVYRGAYRTEFQKRSLLMKLLATACKMYPGSLLRAILRENLAAVAARHRVDRIVNSFRKNIIKESDHA